jgi:hypothetical protein
MARSILLVLAILVSFGRAQASTTEQRTAALMAQPTCETFVRFDDKNLYLGFGHYKEKFEEPRFPIPAAVKVVDVADPSNFFGFKTEDGTLDAISDGNSLYVLTFTAIEEFDLTTHQRIGIYPTTHNPSPLEYMQHARAFARYGNTLVIAHGRLGISFFDMKSKMTYGQRKLVMSHAPHESTAMDINVVDHYAIIALDGFTLPTPNQGKPFEGLVIYDLATNSVVAERDGLDSGVDAIINDGSKLIVSYRGMPIWKYSLSSLIGSGKTMPNPLGRIWKYPLMGHPIGKPAVDETNYYTCFVNVPETQDGKVRVIPQVLNRAAIGLD